jgi:hypothetical protein
MRNGVIARSIDVVLAALPSAIKIAEEDCLEQLDTSAGLFKDRQELGMMASGEGHRRPAAASDAIGVRTELEEGDDRLSMAGLHGSGQGIVVPAVADVHIHPAADKVPKVSGPPFIGGSEELPSLIAHRSWALVPHMGR